MLIHFSGTVCRVDHGMKGATRVNIILEPLLCYMAKHNI